MMKKLLTVLLIVLLAACAKENTEPVKDEYIDPVRDVFIFAQADVSLQGRLKEANNGFDYRNYQFEMLFKDIYDRQITDIEGNAYDLNQHENVILQIVSVECEHCHRQIEMIDDLLDETDALFVQYFNVGTASEIKSLYHELYQKIPEDICIVDRDEGIKDYIKDYLKVEKYPTLVCFKNGKVSFCAEGETDPDTFARINRIGFIDPIKKEELVDAQGRELLSLNRSLEEVKNSLSVENREKITELDHDGYTEELTYQLIGNPLDFSKTGGSAGEIYISDIGDFTPYRQEELVLIYTFLRDNSETEKVGFINELIDSNNSVKYIVVLIEGAESSSAALKNMKTGFHCPVVSILGFMPDDFFRFGLIAYPSAVFVEKGVFAGAYSDIESKEKFNQAIEMFLGDDSLVYKKNN
ncbi:MAG: hypothetical protein IKE50_03360 [Erysipelotrichaceae bacterium]|nr:hypothetical protein [Erysipelotrichaceae bacterium]MBR2533801.1 hypothetical protein [Erysipelotrichaceae bacterium]